MLTSMVNVFLMVSTIMLLSFISRQKHLLMSLMALEGLMLSLVLYLPSILTTAHIHMKIMCVLLLTMGACEAGLGLALMINMVRHHGTDLLKLLTLNKC